MPISAPRACRDEQVTATRKPLDRPRTSDDTRIAACGGQAAFEYFIKHGKLPVSK
ncbi:hypothetical protein SAMN04244574_04488 [Azotobacter beijerinckii]|uniref:Uncharacterized protein n=1 Tax=Azotobacter beijerinckii TaxID=170623 RepID=A0A1I4I740_9GAMM|nr:hypothetical protein SAMN04244574_04488 [Azotobacter beijerinckii]